MPAHLHRHAFTHAGTDEVPDRGTSQIVEYAVGYPKRPGGVSSAGMAGPFRIVQPWGPDTARQATRISEHATAAEAFREIDRLASEMVRTGAPLNAVSLIMVDAHDRLVPRPNAT